MVTSEPRYENTFHDDDGAAVVSMTLERLDIDLPSTDSTGIVEILDTLFDAHRSQAKVSSFVDVKGRRVIDRSISRTGERRLIEKACVVLCRWVFGGSTFFIGTQIF